MLGSIKEFCPGIAFTTTTANFAFTLQGQMVVPTGTQYKAQVKGTCSPAGGLAVAFDNMRCTLSWLKMA